jgi:hypothetical protein
MGRKVAVVADREAVSDFTVFTPSEKTILVLFELS